MHVLSTPNVILLAATQLFAALAQPWPLIRIRQTARKHAGMEQFDAARENIDGRAIRLLVYRHWWSHRPEKALQTLRKARYVQVSEFQAGLAS